MVELQAMHASRNALIHRLNRALLLALLSLLIALGFVWSHPREGCLLDFGSFVASGRAAAEGKDPYGVYPLTFKVYFERIGTTATPNLNPPISVPVFQALAQLDPAVALRTWYILSLALYLTAVVLLAHLGAGTASILRITWALSLAGLWHTLELGQIYTLLLLVTAGAWILLQRGQRIGAGLMIGVLVAIKPNFAVWPLLLLVGGEAVTALAAGGCVAFLSVLPVAIYGPGIYGQWLAASRSFQGYLLPGNSSLPGLAARLGLPWLGIALAASLILASAILVWRCRPSALAVSGLGLVVSLLASPITWLGYTMLLVPALLTRRWTPCLRAGALALVLPFPVVLLFFQNSQWQFVAVGWTYGWALLLVLAGLAQETLAQARPHSTHSLTNVCATQGGQDRASPSPGER